MTGCTLAMKFKLEWEVRLRDSPHSKMNFPSTFLQLSTFAYISSGLFYWKYLELFFLYKMIIWNQYSLHEGNGVSNYQICSNN